MNYPIYALHYKTIDKIHILESKTAKQVIIDLLNNLIKQKLIVMHAWCLTDHQLDIIAHFPAPSSLKKFENHFLIPSAASVIQCLKDENDSRLDWIYPHLENASTQLKSIHPFLLWQTSTEKKLLSQKNKHELYNALNEIHRIPIEFGWIQDPCHYTYSSCYSYAGGIGLINLRLLHLGE
ncbi:hypothetical protein [Gynurincola endophyticus]|jgi:putative transposase|uniref:hypothetical protein n=1 Tax=Gynurincola endophyticus TaxID=2479004 RepID=UPI000F8CE43A|nr:hypothetical protein [Gynurincola endophyticus]